MVDFFGNVQNVEVEHANATEPGSLKEDLIEIARLVEKWRKRDRDFASLREPLHENKTDAPPSSQFTKARNVAPVRMAAESSWEKRLVGASVLGACAAVWLAGSILGRPSV